MKTFRCTAAIAIAAFLFIFSACGQPTETTSYITLSAAEVAFSCYAETKEVSITTNVEGLSLDSAPDWCTPALESDTLRVTVTANETSAARSAVITVRGGEAPAAALTVTQEGIALPAAPAVNDVKIPVAIGTASSSQSNEGIEKSYDGNMSTLYHSSYITTTFPVTLTYTFTGAASMDYLVYYARTDNGTNGKFKELELWVAHNGGALQKYGDYNFNGATARVSFEPPLVNPTQIQFKILSGVGDFASCAEMEFYRKAPASFDWLTVFTDNSCSALRAGITRADIDAIPEPFFKDLALQIFLNRYDAEFRVQEYRAWPHPDEDAAQNKTSPYSLRDNPTGIYVEQGEDLVVFAALQGQNVSLLTQDLSTGGWGTQHTYPLSAGLNKITALAKGLIYVQYYSPQPAAAPMVTLNIATGKVNGYFDSQKHAAADWTRLLNKAVADDFDLVGKYAHLTFPTARFKDKTPDGKALVDEWDKLVKLEHEFMGLYAHNRVFRNRIYCHTDYNSAAAWMYASSYHTGYSLPSIDPILTVSTFKTSGIWGPAHEIGHVNQVRPGFRWAGMTEVTNNLYSLHVQTSFGNTSRLRTDGVYTTAFAKLRNQNKPHNDTVGGGFDVWTQLVPFWQLKLYLCDELGKADFYKDLYYYYMTHGDPGSSADTDGRYQLDFVRQSCRIANLNLTAFFESWGFLKPIDITLNDYGTTRFTITQEQINALKEEIAIYPAPARDFTGITD